MTKHVSAPRLARPYTITGGRTHAFRADLPIEALVTRTERGASALGTLRFERLEIVTRTADPLSIAEIAAHLHVPLGAARVLVDDLAGDRLVHVEVPEGDRPTIDILERVLHGLEAL